MDLAISLRCGGRVAAPVTATTDFLAPDIVNRHGRGSGSCSRLGRILRTASAVNLSLTEAGGPSALSFGTQALAQCEKPSPILTPGDGFLSSPHREPIADGYHLTHRTTIGQHHRQTCGAINIALTVGRHHRLVLVRDTVLQSSRHRSLNSGDGFLLSGHEMGGRRLTRLRLDLDQRLHPHIDIAQVRDVDG